MLDSLHCHEIERTMQDTGVKFSTCLKIVNLFHLEENFVCSTVTRLKESKIVNKYLNFTIIFEITGIHSIDQFTSTIL